MRSFLGNSPAEMIWDGVVGYPTMISTTGKSLAALNIRSKELFMDVWDTGEWRERCSIRLPSAATMRQQPIHS
jgi:hypothetical protein